MVHLASGQGTLARHLGVMCAPTSRLRRALTIVTIGPSMVTVVTQPLTELDSAPQALDTVMSDRTATCIYHIQPIGWHIAPAAT